jgi:hypothetical protein
MNDAVYDKLKEVARARKVIAYSELNAVHNYWSSH